MFARSEYVTIKLESVSVSGASITGMLSGASQKFASVYDVLIVTPSGRLCVDSAFELVKHSDEADDGSLTTAYLNMEATLLSAPSIISSYETWRLKNPGGTVDDYWIWLSKNVADGVVTTSKIADAAVTGDKILDGSVTTSKIADGAVTSAKTNFISQELGTSETLVPSVNAVKLAIKEETDRATAAEQENATSIIGTTRLEDGAVTTAKIADGAVTSAKVGSLTITTANISNGAVTGDKIAAGTITEDNIQDGALSQNVLSDNAVSAEKIQDSAVTSAKIADGAVTHEKLAEKSVSTSNIALSSVGYDQLISGAVDTAIIKNGAVTSLKLASDAMSQAMTDAVNEAKSGIEACNVAINAESQARSQNDQLLNMAISEETGKRESADAAHDSRILELEKGIWPLDLTLSVYPKVIEYTGSAQSVNLSYAVRHKGELKMPQSIELLQNGSPVAVEKKESGTVVVDVSQLGSTTFTLNASAHLQDGSEEESDIITSTAKVYVEAVLPIYAGFGYTFSDIVVEENKEVRNTASGTYTKTSEENGVHFFILVPDMQPFHQLKSFVMGGVQFVMESNYITAGEFNDNYIEYKSGAVFNEGATVNIIAS